MQNCFRAVGYSIYTYTRICWLIVCIHEHLYDDFMMVVLLLQLVSLPSSTTICCICWFSVYPFEYPIMQRQIYFARFVMLILQVRCHLHVDLLNELLYVVVIFLTNGEGDDQIRLPSILFSHSSAPCWSWSDFFLKVDLPDCFDLYVIGG